MRISLLLFIASFFSATLIKAQTYTINTGGTVNTCGGTFYDAGGSAGQYANNSNQTMTFCSTSGNCVRLTFTSFSTEATYDVVSIYNGPTTASPLLGSYSGSTNPGTITATSGCLTIRFTSDGSVQGNGWAANISCVTCPPPPVPNNQDCQGAIPVCQSSYSQSTSYSGVGNISNEINTSLSCLLSGEKNDVWYQFTVQQSGNLCFSITPNVTTEDYDWALFNLTNANCSDIASNAALQVSCNYSGLSGVTGANGQAGSQNNPCVPVTAGQSYVLNVSNFTSSQNGYNLNFGASSAVIFDNVPPSILSVNTPVACGATTLTFNFSENIRCNTVSAADFSLSGPGGPYTISAVTGAGCAAGAASENTFTVTVSPAITTSGAYSLCLTNNASSVTDLCGNVAPTGCLNFNITGVTATITSTNNVSCFGGNNGSATVSGSGGSTPYTYSWNTTPAQTTATATGLTAGTYTATVISSTGCSGIATAIITQPTALTATQSQVNVTCTTTGSATVVASGGTAPYTYSWSNGAGNVATASNLAAGNYTVAITDSKGCQITRTFTITQSGTVTASFSAVANQCVTGNSFSFTNTSTSSSGGAMTYSWSFPGATPSTSTATNPTGISWPAAGTYTVTLTATQGTCTNTYTQNITVYPVPVVTTSVTNVLCNGGTTGSATATGGGTYSWNTTPVQNTATANNLAAGTYTVTVTSVNGCTTTATAVITQPTALTATQSQVNVLCNGAATGSASVVASGGTSPYTYAWSNGATTATASGLTAGSYTVTIRDANNCTITRSFTITEPTLVVLNTSSTNATCGQSNGSVSVTATGGTAPYTYSWNTTPAQTTATTSATLPAGSYQVTVTDANGCVKTATVTISNTSAPTATATGTNVLCFGNSTGSATVSVAGAAGPYTYSWSTTPVQTTATATNLAAGTYNVSVTAGNGCIATTTVTITQPTAALTATTSQVNVSCNGSANGSATVVASGGTGAYTYSWNTSPVQTAATASNLAAGAYQVTITDANGCSIVRNFTITQPPAMTLTTSSTNATCGSANGTATVTATGGTGALTYSWSSTPVQTTATATGLLAGAYTIRVTDANGCSQTANVSVNNNAAPTASITGTTNVSCFGGTNGSATVSAAGGTGAFTYSWNTTPVQTGTTATGLSAGTYAVTVTDASGCSASTTATITQPTLLTASATGINPGCNGATTGSATVSAGGGQAAYTYSWNSTPAQTGATATNLGSGNYSVTVTDANGCTVTASVTLTQPTAITVSATQDSVTCFGLSTGSATATASGGTGALTYSWAPSGITSATANGLAAGNYTVTVTDANGCTATATTTVLQPSALTASTTTTNVACNGGTNGTATVTAAGGTPTYQYSWSNGATTATAGTLGAGSYTVTVTDANGCQQTTSANITQPSALTVSASSGTSNCGQSNATATATASGGTGSLTYSWSTTPSQATPTATGLGSGTYTVTVTDANGCTAGTTTIINNLTGGTASVTSTNASCFGSSNGTATATMTGGAAPFTYSWNTTPSQTTATASGLAAGTYSVTITDNVGCQATAGTIITQPAQITASTTVTNATCFGSATGTATVAASGGTGTYTYQWNTTPTQTTVTAGSLAAGTYTVTVTDAYGCTANASAIITEPTAITATTTTVNENCTAQNGSATVTASGGTGTLTYSWNTTPSQTSATATALATGTYSVTVTDANNCTRVSQAVVGTTPGGTATTTTTPVSCNGGNNGTATVSMSGAATSPFTYSWNTTPSQTTATATGLVAGTYSVTVTDTYGCISSTQAVIVEPSILTASTTQVDVTCNGGSNGSATVTVTGGTAPYTYSWSNGPTTATNPGLSAGSQTVIITDNKGCIKSATVNISEPAAITVTETAHTDATCNQSNGSSTVSATGGAGGPYTYSWSPGPYSGATVNNLPANTYIITATDAAGCTTTFPVTIQNLSGPTISTTSTNVSCFGGNNGSASVTASGGATPYSYTWNTAPQQTTPSATNLTAGIYTVIVRDNTGCSASASVTITQPPVLVLNTSATNPSCFAGCNGQAGVVVSGGVSPYTYSWTSGSTGSTASSLCAGSYTVVVTDANGCTSNASVVLTNPAQLSVATSVVNASCQGACDGNATATVSNGSTPYTYSWTGGQTTPSATQLCAGTFTVSVSDVNGCQAQGTAIINQPVSLQASIPTSGNVSCFGGANGYANATATGGTAPYTYTWSPGGYNTPSPNGLTTGSYTVTISDSKGCSAQASVFISQPAALIATTTKTNATCYNLCNGSATATVQGGTGPYTYLWTPGGQTTATASNLCAGNYNLNLTDANGCTVVNSVTITQPSILAVTTSVINSNCQQDNGKACASIAGGVAPYSYQWNDPAMQTTSCATNLFANSYMITVTDANGCTAQAPANVNDIQGPTVTITSSTNITCYGDSNGTALANISGGVAPFTIAWSPTGPTSTFANNLAQGWHSITVTDSAGCVGSASQFISQPAQISGFITSVNPSCFGSCNGSATITAAGGSGPLTYFWNSTPSQTSITATDLCAGVYTVTVRDSNNCEAQFSKTLTQPQQLVLGTGNITNVSCNGMSDGIITVNPSGGTPAYNVQWSPATAGTGTQVSGLSAGSYTATITDAKGCTDVMTYTVNEPQILLVTATSDPGTCGENNGSVMAQAGGGNPPFSFVWNDPLSQNNDTASNLYAGTYVVVVTDTKGCTGTDTVQLYDIPGPTLDSVSTVNVSCYNTATGSATVFPKGGTLPYTYLWNDPSAQTTAQATGLVDGTYGITVTDANGCVATSTATITEPTLLSIIETADTTICYGQAAIGLFASAQGGTPAYTYSWSNSYTGAGPNNVQPLTTTSYYIQVTDKNGCIAKDTVNVTVRPRLQITGRDTTICSGEPVTLTTSSTGGKPSGYTYTWTPNVSSQPDFSPSPNLTSTTTYIVELNDGCSSSAKDTIVVSVNPKPFVSINPVTNVCVPASVSFSATTDIGLNFSWNIPGVGTSNSTTPTFTFNQAGSYDVTVTATSVNGCSTTVTENGHIVIYPKPVASFTTDQSTTTIVNPVIQFTDMSIDAAEWNWNFGDEDTSLVKNPSHMYQDTGKYVVQLIVTSQYGCTDDTTTLITIDPDHVVYVPNAFSPNGDDINDRFGPVGVGINPDKFEMLIFDRWGNQIFRTSRLDEGWDGKANNGSGIAQEDVYIWMINAESMAGETINRKGTVALVK